MTEYQILDPNSIIIRNRKWYKKNRSNDTDNDCRIVRTFNLIKRADKLDDYTMSKVIALWAAFNSTYHCIDNRAKISKHQNKEPVTYNSLLTQLIRLDNKYIDNGDELQREPAEPWCKIMLDNLKEDSAILVDNVNFYGYGTSHTNIAKEQNRLNKNLIKPNNLCKILDRVYYFRNFLVHGIYDPQTYMFVRELEAAQNFLYATLAFILQIMLEHPSRKWGKVMFPFAEPKLQM